MDTVRIKPIADAILYEGYLLYPYRRSVKNRQRWTFGGLFPPAYAQTRGETEPCSMRTECLVAGYANAKLEVQVRFLHLRLRFAGLPGTEPWQEAIERDVSLVAMPLAELESPRRQAFFFPASREQEAVPGADNLLVREQQALSGVVEVSAERVGDGRFRVAASIHNRTPLEDAGNKTRDEALLRSFVSAHTILGIRGGAFVSLIDPPKDWRELAAGCRNVASWPVLVGEEGVCDTLLSAPIVLYDYPRVAPESPGDLYDGTEVDEILCLRIRTLTDEEKRSAGAVDDRARQLIERTEQLGREQLLRLHGTMHAEE